MFILLKKQLLEAKNLLEFDTIICKYKIPKYDWQTDDTIMKHYNYLKSLIPEDFRSPQISIALRKKNGKEHSN